MWWELLPSKISKSDVIRKVKALVSILPFALKVEEEEEERVACTEFKTLLHLSQI